MPDKRVAPLFLELGERLEKVDGRKVLKELLMWLANSQDDKPYSKSQLLQQLDRLTAYDHVTQGHGAQVDPNSKEP